MLNAPSDIANQAVCIHILIAKRILFCWIYARNLFTIIRSIWFAIGILPIDAIFYAVEQNSQAILRRCFDIDNTRVYLNKPNLAFLTTWNNTQECRARHSSIQSY